MTTRQTIASTPPVHIKISSPIPPKKSLAFSDTFSQKSLASRSKSPAPSKSAQSDTNETSETSETSETNETNSTQR